MKRGTIVLEICGVVASIVRLNEIRVRISDISQRMKAEERTCNFIGDGKVAGSHAVKVLSMGRVQRRDADLRVGAYRQRGKDGKDRDRNRCQATNTNEFVVVGKNTGCLHYLSLNLWKVEMEMMKPGKALGWIRLSSAIKS